MRTKIDIKPNTYIYIVLLLFLIPLKWMLAWLLAAGLHEICHWLAVKLCGAEIYNITIGLGGVKMECSPMTNKKKIFALLCGPIGGLIPLMFAYWIPRTALISWVLSMYNLLPLLPLDGGRVLKILIGTKVYTIQKLFLILLSIGAVYVSIALRFGFLPLVIIIILWVKSRNTPCKADTCKVQ